MKAQVKEMPEYHVAYVRKIMNFITIMLRITPKASGYSIFVFLSNLINDRRHASITRTTCCCVTRKARAPHSSAVSLHCRVRVVAILKGHDILRVH